MKWGSNEVALNRIVDCLSQLYVKDTTLNDKQELREDFDRDVLDKKKIEIESGEGFEELIE